MFEVRPPWSGEEVSAELERVDEEIAGFFRVMEARVFLSPQGEKWSPADHLRHLTKSVRPLARGMGLPGPVIGLRFGRPRRASRTYEEVRQAYVVRLAEGVTAGRYAPSTPSSPGEGEAGKARIIASWQDAGRALRTRLPRWSEAKLDGYQAPHPALGMLTIREMLFFTLYHNVHHARLVAERR